MDSAAMNPSAFHHLSLPRALPLPKQGHVGAAGNRLRPRKKRNEIEIESERKRHKEREMPNHQCCSVTQPFNSPQLHTRTHSPSDVGISRPAHNVHGEAHAEAAARRPHRVQQPPQLRRQIQHVVAVSRR